MTQNFGAPNSIIIARYRPGRGFELVTLAQGLLAAMTAQLYEAIQRGKGYGECPECGRCFIRERANQVYCGKTCGDRWRKRKERYGGHRTAQSAA
jgi:hypothetical protein